MIQAVFYAKRPADLYNEYAVAATNRRLLLRMLNYFGRVTGMAGEAPRQTRLGPCSGILRAIRAFDAPLQVSFRFFKDVNEADRAAGLYKAMTVPQDLHTERNLPEERHS